MDLIQGVAGGRPFVPARLRIVERRGNVNGQAVRYVVPVIDVSIRYSEVLGGQGGQISDLPARPALPSGYIPIEKPTGNGSTLADGLREAETQTLAKPPRVPLAEDDEILVDDPGASPLPQGTQAASQETSGNTIATSTRDRPATKPQRDKMNVLVGTLRDAGQIKTEHLWIKLAKVRNVEVETMMALLDGRDAEGVLHWSPLRDSMTRAEAHVLIDALEGLEVVA
ncbi:MAG: hypothetical protein H0U59_02015 [Gemmatimonadaceae bacterium]|nr:hypothetical protein [Gemmatimonadaceae bacterium]